METTTSVVHVSASDTQGGAARSAYRLHRAMLDDGMSSRMRVQVMQSRDPSVAALGTAGPKGMIARIGHLLDRRRLEAVRRRRGRTLMFSLDTVPWTPGDLPDHDVLHLHWVAGFVDFTDLAVAGSRRKPIVWTLHDMNPLTGGCHYPGACGRYATGCYRCPLLGSRRNCDLAWRSWRRRLAFFRAVSDGDVRFVSPSQWLARAAGASPFLKGCEVAVIPYGIDLRVFRPTGDLGMRAALDIRADAHVVLVLAARLSDLRKGGEPFFRALSQGGILRGDQAVLLAVGRDLPAAAESLPHRFVGPVEDDRLLAALYNCADIMLMPTLEDNLPNTAIEAIACGVPVVSYATGGLPDIIGNDEAGAIVPTGDVGLLLRATQHLLDDVGSLRMRKASARDRAERLFPAPLQASRYRSLYGGMLAERESRGIAAIRPAVPKEAANP